MRGDLFVELLCPAQGGLRQRCDGGSGEHGETAGQVTGDLDCLFDRALVLGDMVRQCLGECPFQDHHQTGVVDFQQPHRTAPGEGALGVRFTEVARVRKRHFQHGGSGRVLHGYYQRNLAVGRRAVDDAVPAPAGCVDDARQLLEPCAAIVAFTQSRDLCQGDRDVQRHDPTLEATSGPHATAGGGCCRASARTRTRRPMRTTGPDAFG